LLENDWVSARVCRSANHWLFIFQIHNETFEEVVDDSDETKSLMQDNLWDAGWFSMLSTNILETCLENQTEAGNAAPSNNKDCVKSASVINPNNFGGDSFQLQLAIPSPDNISSFQLFDKVFRGDHLYLQTKSTIRVHQEEGNDHVFFFAALPIIEDEVCESPGRIMAIIYNSHSSRAEFVPFGAIEAVENSGRQWDDSKVMNNLKVMNCMSDFMLAKNLFHFQLRLWRLLTKLRRIQNQIKKI
jgi:hypothetical protein